MQEVALDSSPEFDSHDFPFRSDQAYLPSLTSTNTQGGLSRPSCRTSGTSPIFLHIRLIRICLRGVHLAPVRRRCVRRQVLRRTVLRRRRTTGVHGMHTIAGCVVVPGTLLLGEEGVGQFGVRLVECHTAAATDHPL
jgi:hypothetical protein